MNIYDIIARAQSLSEETRLASVTPDRVGGLVGDTLRYINQYQLKASSPLIHKTYPSVSAMQLDAAPVSDVNGRALAAGQLVVIVSDDDTVGDVYRYDGPSGTTSAWTYVSKIGGVPADQTLDGTSLNPVSNAAVTTAINALKEKHVSLSEEEYASLDEVDPDTFYYIEEEE